MASVAVQADIELSSLAAPKNADARITPEPSASVSSEPPAQYPSGIKLILITIGLVLSIFLSALDTTILATAIPRITDEFGSIGNIAWYGSAYAITNTAFQSSWGKAYNYFNLKYAFLAAIAVFEAGNVICATAPSSEALIVGRIVAGVGGGGIMTGAFIIIALTARPEYRAAYMGVLGVTFGVSSVVGPLMGGALTDGPGWRWCFWVSLPIGFTAALTMFLFLTPPMKPKEASFKERIVQMDIVGGVLIASALSCFVLAMHWSGIYSWSSYRAVLVFVGFIILSGLFIANEWYMDDKAMVQRRFFTKPTILANLVYIFLLAGVYFPLLYTLPVQFQSVYNASASQSGVRLIPLVLGISIFTMIANVILTFWRHYKPFLTVGALLSTAGVVAMYTLGPDASSGDWIGFELLTAVGVGLALQIPMIANQAAVSADDIATVTSLSLFCENIGTTLFVAAGEAAFTQGLMASISQNVPSVDPHVMLDIGATQVRQVFAGSELQKVLASYLDGCKISHIISVACGVGACLVSWGVGLNEVKTKMRKSHRP
ncbi:MFS gliotoxin efflux transporter glia [Lophiotrema nucula]|uniref:MFS gliotoxin efflux transporter glia n=1 Tax=Lophiotrema nucula TaxID=690887 RepID=A0A6A5Z5D4_9PLEO|nr:MFS gliotoxin efflux transporter glia [Lophiotrema nucula]